MKNMTKKLLALLLAVVMVLGLVACGNSDKPVTSDPVNTNTPAGNDPVSTDPVEEPTYTYNTYMGASPLNWNPHAWEMSNEDTLMSYITAPFVDISIADDGVNYTWVYEAATAITDVTATFADRDKWGITEESGRVYQIDLNPDLKWNDGTPINADDYIYSMQQLFNPEMKNYRANSYYTGSTTAVQGGYGYYNNDKVGQNIYSENTPDGATAAVAADTWVKGADGAYTDANGNPLYIAVSAVLNGWLGGNSLKDYVDAYGADMFDVAAFEALAAAANEDGLAPLTEETYANLVKVITYSADWGEDESCVVYYTYYVSGVYEETSWDEVGLLKAGDYSLYYILETPCTEFYFLSNMTSGWLVKEDLYEAGKKQVENLVATDYCTSLETTASTGPYMLVSFETDKQLRLTRNPYWYGWTDGKHEGQYQTTDIVFDIIAEHNTAMQLFNQGNLDDVELTSDDMVTYRMSDYLQKTDQTYTFRYIFASDLTALTALEEKAGDGSNKRVLSYDDFRKAISLAMDRATFNAEATPGYKPAYYLLNYLYYYDIENNPNSQYRNTKEGKEAVLRLYGIEYGEGKAYATVDEAYDAVTGYDLEAARALFQSVYEQAIADGNYTDGQAININCMASAASSLTTDDTRQQDLLNDMIGAATVGTGFEGKITFTFQSGSSTRYDDVAAGKVEMIRGAWGGAAFYPFSTIRVYCEPDYMGGLALIHESCGWDPSVEKMTVTADFDGDGTVEEKTDTLQNWAKSINGGGAYDGQADLSMLILSSLETAILGSYQCIPWGTETLCSLFSQQIEFATLEYNIMYGYGGIRLMTYNYSDAEWAEYVASQGGTLNYE